MGIKIRESVEAVVRACDQDGSETHCKLGMLTSSFQTSHALPVLSFYADIMRILSSRRQANQSAPCFLRRKLHGLRQHETNSNSQRPLKLAHHNRYNLPVIAGLVC